MIFRTVKCLVALSFTLLALEASAEPVAAKGTAERAIAAALDPFVTDQQLSGYVTILMKDGKPVATTVRGYADIATQRPLTKDSIFRIFSMTKPVTGAALMILHDRGKWKFSDPIAKFLPELANLRVYRSMDAAGNLVSEPAGVQPTRGSLSPTPPGSSMALAPHRLTGNIRSTFRPSPRQPTRLNTSPHWLKFRWGMNPERSGSIASRWTLKGSSSRA
jgi:hypothetical protein